MLCVLFLLACKQASERASKLASQQEHGRKASEQASREVNTGRQASKQTRKQASIEEVASRCRICACMRRRAVTKVLCLWCQRSQQSQERHVVQYEEGETVSELSQGQHASGVARVNCRKDQAARPCKPKRENDYDMERGQHLPSKCRYRNRSEIYSQPEFLGASHKTLIAGTVLHKEHPNFDERNIFFLNFCRPNIFFRQNYLLRQRWVSIA